MCPKCCCPSAGRSGFPLSWRLKQAVIPGERVVLWGRRGHCFWWKREWCWGKKKRLWGVSRGWEPSGNRARESKGKGGCMEKGSGACFPALGKALESARGCPEEKPKPWAQGLPVGWWAWQCCVLVSQKALALFKSAIVWGASAIWQRGGGWGDVVLSACA